MRLRHHMPIFGLAISLLCQPAFAEEPDMILHNFAGGPGGAAPAVGLTADGRGGFYGETLPFGDYNGAVFDLSAPTPPDHHWTLSLPHVFQGQEDGAGGAGTLTPDGHGNLFGVTGFGGRHQQGSVFELSPPSAAAGRWTLKTIYSFQGRHVDGVYATGGVIFDASGSLYGVTEEGGDGPCPQGCGVVFRLSPPAGASSGPVEWTETLLHQFQASLDGALPIASLIMSPAGDLYGSATAAGLVDECDGGCGAIFRLSPMEGASGWRFTVIRELTPDLGDAPLGPLLLDAAGNLYGTAYAWGRTFHGTAFELSPPRGGERKWKASLLHTFAGGDDGYFPKSALIADATGALYGTEQFGGRDSLGVVYKLTPPAAPGGRWTERIVHAFRYHHDGSGPTAPVIFGPGGMLFGTTFQGGKSNQGAVFEMTP